MDGTILSIKAPGQEPAFILTSNNNTKVCSRSEISWHSGLASDLYWKSTVSAGSHAHVWGKQNQHKGPIQEIGDKLSGRFNPTA